MSSLLARLLSVTLFLMIISCSQNNGPDTIWLGGRVITVDTSNSVTEAVASKDGVIIQLGSRDEILATANASTKIIDISGKTLIPGFVAAHEHPTLTAVFSKAIDVSGFTYSSAIPMWLNLKKRVADTDEGEWVFAMGLDPVLMPDLISPDIEFLDKLSPDNPLLIISQTMHSFWANSKAFEEAGIDQHSPDPGNGSYYGKNSKGELNGFISESAAAAPFLELLKSPLSMVNRYQQALQQLVNSGFTSVASLGFNMPPMLAKYASSDNFSPRIRQFIYLAEHELGYLPDAPTKDDDFYQIMGIKLWRDGSPYTGTMVLSENYLNNPLTAKMGITANHRGVFRIGSTEFGRKIKLYSQQGWQLAVHSQGDRSNVESLSAFKSLLNDQGIALRHRFEHCLLIPKSTLAGFKPLGITPSFHINHIYYYGDALAKSVIGSNRAQLVLPLKTAFDLHLHPTIHADSPMFPADPFSLMKTAITRQTKNGLTLGGDQAISVQQALRAMTINAAWQLHMEDKIGSIEVGKLADFTLLSDNLYTLPVAQWSQIKVEQVWLSGEEKIKSNGE